MTIQALNTWYGNHRFRSRLEARWAVFLDHLGIRWEYEGQGYRLPAGPYLPDFWLPDLQASMCSPGTWLEIKPESAELPQEDPRWAQLALHGEHPLVVAFGLPERESGDRNQSMQVFMPANGYWDNYHWFVECPTCSRFEIQFEARTDRLHCHKIPEGRGDDSLRIRDATRAALSARFEHGQRG